MGTYFTSDTHLGHGTLIRNGSRSFADVAEMDRTIVARWNETVGQDDDVWHLGDFSAYRDGRLDGAFWRLNGRKHLIIGNHDEENDAILALPWASPPEKHLTIHVEGQALFLCHYPAMTWPGIRNGALHLYGHMHGALPGFRDACDVGVDAWDMRPVQLDAIRRRLRTLPARRDIVPARKGAPAHAAP